MKTLKNKGLYIATIIFFLLVNTTYYWESKMGMFAMVTFLLLILYFLVLTVLLLGQTFFAIREKLKNRQRLFLIGLMTVVLGLSFFYPGGIMNFELFESESLLIAQREGAANCRTVLKLKKNNKFSEKSICFGVSETSGEYRIENDTIFFHNITYGRHESDYFQFAVFKETEGKDGKAFSSLVRFKNIEDTTGMELLVIKNNLTK